MGFEKKAVSCEKFLLNASVIREYSQLTPYPAKFTDYD